MHWVPFSVSHSAVGKFGYLGKLPAVMVMELDTGTGCEVHPLNQQQYMPLSRIENWMRKEEEAKGKVTFCFILLS